MYQIAAIVGFGRVESPGPNRQRQEGGGARPARRARASRPRSTEFRLGAWSRSRSVAELFEPAVCHGLARETARLPRLGADRAFLGCCRPARIFRGTFRKGESWPAAWTSSPDSGEENDVGPEAPRPSIPAGRPGRGRRAAERAASRAPVPAGSALPGPAAPRAAGNRAARWRSVARFLQREPPVRAKAAGNAIMAFNAGTPCPTSRISSNATS